MATVTKRKWTYEGIEKSAWVVRWTDAAGKRKTKTFEMKKQADAYRIDVEGEKLRGDQIGDQTMLVRELTSLFDRQNIRRVADGGLTKSGAYHIRLMLNRVDALFGKVRVRDIKPDHFLMVYRALVDERGHHPFYARDKVMKLKGLIDFAKRRKLIHTKFDALSVAISEIGELEKPESVKTFTEEQIKRLLAAVEHRPAGGHKMLQYMTKIFVHLATFCGLRVGEIIGLPLTAVDFETGILTVRQSYSRLDGLKSPKTRAGYREVMVPGHILEMLKVWIEEFHRPNDAGLMFTTKTGAPAHPTSFHIQGWRPLLERAGIPAGYHFHALRHFAASAWLERGLDVVSASKLLGHARPATTLNVYGHVINQRTAHRAVQEMAQGLLPAGALA